MAVVTGIVPVMQALQTFQVEQRLLNGGKAV
jgi:hypothetical protein